MDVLRVKLDICKAGIAFAGMSTCY